MGKLILISGPSGAGKDAMLSHYLSLRSRKVKKLISTTTRKPRRNSGVLEKNGVEYNFVDLDHFNSNEFLEENEVYKDCWYGTPLKDVICGFNEGALMIKNVDIEGANLAKEKLEKLGFGKNLIQIGLLSPSIDILKKRLFKRDGKIDKERIARAEYEINLIKNSILKEQIMINSDLEISRKKFKVLIDKNFKL